MDPVAILAVIFTFVLAIVALGMSPLIISAFRSSPREKRANLEQDRSLAQELYANLEKMEKRLETLETILTEEIKVEEALEMPPTPPRA